MAMRGTFSGSILVAACLGLAACQTPPAPEAAAPPPAPEPPTAPPPAPPPPRTASTAWSFSPAQRCTATAAGSAAAIDVAATDRAVTWAVRGRIVAAASPARTVPLAFTGVSGSWTVPGRPGRGRIVASQALSEYQASQVLLMLSGGTLRLGTGAGAPTIRVPNAGQAGKTWFECVRKRLLP